MHFIALGQCTYDGGISPGFVLIDERCNAISLADPRVRPKEDIEVKVSSVKTDALCLDRKLSICCLSSTLNCG